MLHFSPAPLLPCSTSPLPSFLPNYPQSEWALSSCITSTWKVSKPLTKTASRMGLSVAPRVQQERPEGRTVAKHQWTPCPRHTPTSPEYLYSGPHWYIMPECTVSSRHRSKETGSNFWDPFNLLGNFTQLTHLTWHNRIREPDSTPRWQTHLRSPCQDHWWRIGFHLWCHQKCLAHIY